MTKIGQFLGVFAGFSQLAQTFLLRYINCMSLNAVISCISFAGYTEKADIDFFQVIKGFDFFSH